MDKKILDKVIFAAAIALIPSAHADSKVLATNSSSTDITLPSGILGGTVIMIPKKGHLAIDGETYHALECELGLDRREELIRGFILRKPADELEREFEAESKPATLRVIIAYSKLG